MTRGDNDNRERRWQKEPRPRSVQDVIAEERERREHLARGDVAVPFGDGVIWLSKHEANI